MNFFKKDYVDQPQGFYERIRVENFFTTKENRVYKLKREITGQKKLLELDMMRLIIISPKLSVK